MYKRKVCCWAEVLMNNEYCKYTHVLTAAYTSTDCNTHTRRVAGQWVGVVLRSRVIKMMCLLARLSSPLLILSPSASTHISHTHTVHLSQNKRRQRHTNTYTHTYKQSDHVVKCPWSHWSHLSAQKQRHNKCNRVKTLPEMKSFLAVSYSALTGSSAQWFVLLIMCSHCR